MTRLTTLHPKLPYRFDLLLDGLMRHTHPTLDISYDGAYWRALQAGAGLVLFRVSATAGAFDSPALAVHVMSQNGQPDMGLALETLLHILPCDIDKTDFYAYAAADSPLWQVVEPLVGCPPIRSASMFEALLLTIIEQQIAWVTAQRAQRWLLEWCGARLTYQNIAYYAFPTPQQIASASIDDLKPLKITFKRMNVILDVARQISAGTLDIEGLRHQPPQAAYNALKQIKGIGHWTAAVTLLRACGHTDEVAYNDVALQAAVNRYFYGGAGRIPPQQVIDTFKRYDPYAGLAAHYTLQRWERDQYKRRDSLTFMEQLDA